MKDAWQHGIEAERGGIALPLLNMESDLRSALCDARRVGASEVEKRSRSLTVGQMGSAVQT
jgi:hypothetical protein